LASIFCYGAIILKDKLGYDDSLDAFGIHGIGGIIGAIFLVFFIRDSWMAETALAAGGVWTVWQQLGVQALAVIIAIGYAAILTLIIIFVVDKIVGVRCTDKDELAGLDYSQHGEHGYGMLNAN
jgi:Amt family ammonium transporter